MGCVTRRMIRTEVAQHLLHTAGADGYVFPVYDGYCFSNIPATLGSVLGVDLGGCLPPDVFSGVPLDVDRVVHVLLDGFGFDQWTQRTGGHRFLRVVSDRGTVTPLTSIYPSETAAAITTVHTALTPADHCLLGWYGYFDEVDAVLQTLPFSTVEGTPASEEFGPAVDAGILFSGDPIYERLAAAGIDSYTIQPAETVDTAYTKRSTAGATRQGYDGPRDFATTIRETLDRTAGPSYLYGYVPDIDAVAHEFGTDSDAFEDTLETVTSALFTEFSLIESEIADRTLLVVSADHGHVNTVPSENIDLREYPIWGHLRETPGGEAIPPTGGGRNVHLHVKSGAVDDVRAVLADLDARVFTRRDAIARGLFGAGAYGRRFDRRCGDLVVVHRNRALWHHNRQLSWVGHHGGLTREEMLVPFAAVHLSALTG